MHILFSLAWVASEAVPTNAFKFREASLLFCEYLKRISQFTACKAAGVFLSRSKKGSGIRVWVCTSGEDAQPLSSEEISHELAKAMESGCRELRVVIGGPDGFSKTDMVQLAPNLKWSFGPLTLPHELAAVVASEQIYRAWTILRGLPYHLGH